MDSATLVNIPLEETSQQKKTKSFHAKSPEEARKLFGCSASVLWSIVISAAVIISTLVIPNVHPLSHRIAHWCTVVVTIYEIFTNWSLVRKKRPIFNDANWFDAPPRGWDYCADCHQHRPPRTYHCSLCDCCILKRNHHCHFTGVCIGLGNQRNFIMFLLWVVWGDLYALFTCWHLLSKYYIPLTFTVTGLIGYFMPPLYIFLPLFGLSTWSGCFLMFFICSVTVSCLIALSLLISHFRLILENQTEYERRQNDKSFSKGYLFNFKLVFGQFPSIAVLTIFCPRLNVRSREMDCVYGRPQYTKIM